MDDNYNDKLADLRRQIDGLDKQLLQLLARRMAEVREIGRYKQAHSLAPLDEQRWQTVLQSWLVTAESFGLSEEFITKLYKLIHEYALSIESDTKPS
jgi:chorismate mutase